MEHVTCNTCDTDIALAEAVGPCPECEAPGPPKQCLRCGKKSLSNMSMRYAISQLAKFYAAGGAFAGIASTVSVTATSIAGLFALAAPTLIAAFAVPAVIWKLWPEREGDVEVWLCKACGQVYPQRPEDVERAMKVIRAGLNALADKSGG